MTALLLISIVAASTIILGVVQYEMSIGDTIFLDPKTGREFRVAVVFGREIEVSI